MKIHLFPCGSQIAREHHRRTIEKKLDTSSILSFMSDPESLHLLTEEAYACWGVTRGHADRNLKKWSSMQRGDICLMYRDKAFFSAGKVANKFTNFELAKHLWGENEKGEVWENMFLIDEINDVHIPIEAFNKLMDYGEKFVLQGYMTYDDEVSELIIEELGLNVWDSPFYTASCETDSEKRDRIQSELVRIEKTDSKSYASKRRKEQQLLREAVLGNSETVCSLCHRKLPNELIVAGHIWERSKIKDEEIRKDLNIVMPVCKLGCDELFEKEYLLVNDDGAIVPNTSRVLPADLKDFSKIYAGKKCLHHNEKTEQYFKNRYR